ncbi:hypothetical protein BHAOGJBA_4168 [Methylobacterium hispanicum]|uniref:Uncharacterized protein n=1 Tax=Methylobacterium hispanicum TaxID=270350 RepID=A0AAV4ZRX8_9HYPH|nr:hypothetical protein [Methylobacterium hispanicum]GJD90626.1 hypothetical protein BHAOGJBA_4168 [Methylobacterium hispanicum]
MSRSRILFTVPAEAAGIADVLGDAGATVDDREGLDHDAIAGHLAALAGRTVEAVVDDDDPLSPIHDVVELLERTGCAYFAVVDAFVENSRGMRIVGRLYLNRDGDGTKLEKPIPWDHGEPQLDARTLEAAGIDREEARQIERLFIAKLGDRPRATTPRP